MRKLEHWARRYADSTVSLAKAAENAGVSLWEMMDYCRSREITAQYDMEDWQHDLSVVLGRTSRP